jgi:hypothetical protein
MALFGNKPSKASELSESRALAEHLRQLRVDFYQRENRRRQARGQQLLRVPLDARPKGGDDENE